MERKEPFWTGAIFGGLMMLLTVLAYDRLTSAPYQVSAFVPQDIIVAYNTGARDALKTNPPSMDLEATCLSLWANKN